MIDSKYAGMQFRLSISEMCHKQGRSCTSTKELVLLFNCVQTSKSRCYTVKRDCPPLTQSRIWYVIHLGAIHCHGAIMKQPLSNGSLVGQWSAIRSTERIHTLKAIVFCPLSFKEISQFLSL